MAGLDALGALDDESGGSTGSESAEAFRDRYAKTQAQVKAIKKAEGNARAKDDQLAAILLRLLQTHQNSRLLLLIARCLDHSIPAGLLLGILALTEREAAAEFERLLGTSVQLLALPAGTANRQLAVAAEFSAAHLPPHVRQILDTWAHGLLQFGLTQPQKLLATAISPEGEIFGSLGQLATFTVQDFLASHSVPAEFDGVHHFADLLLKKVLADLKTSLEEGVFLGAGGENF